MISAIIQSITREIDCHRKVLIDLCSRLVSAESISPPGNTRGVADVVESFLEGFGVRGDTVVMDPAAPNIVAVVHGAQPGRHILFNAHMDTMEPGPASNWTVPILELTRKDGRLYGLGLGNMKGALGAMCLVTGLLARHRAHWNGRLTLTAVSDEVLFGERGSATLLRQRNDLLADALISGEGPGYMGLAVAEKGLLWLDVETTADGGHASRARRGATAITELAAALEQLDRLNDWYVAPPPELSELDPGSDKVGQRLSCNIGRIAGGTQRGQIAREAKAELDIRLPPGLGKAAVIAEAQRLTAPYPRTQIREVKGWEANWTDIGSELVRTVSSACRAIRSSAPPYVVRLPASDAMRWRALGVPAICFGPQPTLSAGTDDFVNEQDLVDCAKVYAHATLTMLAAVPTSGS